MVTNNAVGRAKKNCASKPFCGLHPHNRERLPVGVRGARIRLIFCNDVFRANLDYLDGGSNVITRPQLIFSLLLLPTRFASCSQDVLSHDRIIGDAVFKVNHKAIKVMDSISVTKIYRSSPAIPKDLNVEQLETVSPQISSSKCLGVIMTELGRIACAETDVGANCYPEAE